MQTRFDLTQKDIPRSWYNLLHDFPESEAAARETLALPIQPELTEQQAAYVVQCVSEFFSAGATAGQAADTRSAGA